VSRVADREKLLLDKARQFAGKDCRTATSILGQNPRQKISVKNYMSSEQITQEAAATTQTRKR
jgi:hypothetical protein